MTRKGIITFVVKLINKKSIKLINSYGHLLWVRSHAKEFDSCTERPVDRYTDAYRERSTSS